METPSYNGSSVDKKRLKRGLLLALALSAATLVFLSLLTINRDTFNALSRLSPSILLMAMSLSLGRWALSALRMGVILSTMGRKLPFSNLLKTVYGGYFTGLVTPWRAGGITGEAVFLYLYGVPAGEAAAAISFGASVSTILLLLLFPLAIALATKSINLNFTFKGFMFSALGIGIIFVVLVVLAMLRAKNLSVEKVMARSPRFLARRTTYARAVEKFVMEMDRFSSSLRLLFRLRLRDAISVIFLSVSFWLLGFLVVPTVLVGLGYSSYFGHAVLAQLLVQLLMPFLPVPGGSGVGEVGFFWLYQRFLPDPGIASLLTLVWRFIDFYLGLLIGGIFFMWIMRDVSRKNRSSLLRVDGEDTSQETL